MAAESGDIALEVTRTFPADPATVFAAFSEPSLSRWWGPRGLTMASLDFDPRVGEPYRIEMTPPTGDPFFLTGEFREVDPPSRLDFTFAYEEPGPDDIENLVTLSFRNLGGSTEVALTQAPFKTEARRALHRDGWSDSFDRLVARLRD